MCRVRWRDSPIGGVQRSKRVYGLHRMADGTETVGDHQQCGRVVGEDAASNMKGSIAPLRLTIVPFIIAMVEQGLSLRLTAETQTTVPISTATL